MSDRGDVEWQDTQHRLWLAWGEATTQEELQRRVVAWYRYWLTGYDDDTVTGQWVWLRDFRERGELVDWSGPHMDVLTAPDPLLAVVEQEAMRRGLIDDLTFVDCLT